MRAESRFNVCIKRDSGVLLSLPTESVARSVGSSAWSCSTRLTSFPIGIQEVILVPNGLSLCTLHHPAFDRHIIGIRPDLVVEVRADVLNEEDGPMLVHGLQGFQGAEISIPTRKTLQPNREFLAERFELFRQAG